MDHQEQEILTEENTSPEAAAEETPQDSQEAQPQEDHEEQDAPQEPQEAQQEDLTGRVKELEDQLLRKMAEFDNYRRRTTKEKEEIGLNARIKCVGELLPVLDNFERAFAVGCADESFLKGIRMIFDNMTAAFGKMGVEEIKAEGQVFDPELHYAVSRVENPDLGANVVAAVLQKGYRMGGKVIRHAMVAVANAD